MPITQHSLNARLKRIGLLSAFFLPLLTACGGGSGSEDTAVPVKGMSLLAGHPLSGGNQDGPTSTTASFSMDIYGMALTNSGDVVIADSGNNLIRKLSSNYETITTIAGSRSPNGPTFADGTGQEASFNNPSSVAVDAAGNTYVADSGNHLVRKISPTGVVTTLAGQAGVCGSQDGVGKAASFCYPGSISLTKAGIVYLTDGPGYPATTRRVREITPEGVVSTTFQRNLDSGITIATDSVGTLHSGEWGRIQRYDTNGQASVISEGKFHGNVRTLIFDSADRMYVLTSVPGFGLGMFAFSSKVARVESNGSVTELFSKQSYMQSMLVKPDGTFLVADGQRIYSYDDRGTSKLVAGLGESSIYASSVDGQGTAARFVNPGALVLDSNGMLYVREDWMIRAVQSDGLVRTLANGLVGNLAQQPVGLCPTVTGLHTDLLHREYIEQPLATDGAGSLYTFKGNRIVRMRDCRVDLLVDLDQYLNQSDSNYVTGMTADIAGNVYLATWNGIVVKVDTKGTPMLLAGSAGRPGYKDAQGKAAQFGRLGNMTIDSGGNLYVIDHPSDDIKPGGVIRKITPEGTVTTLAGNPFEAPGFADGLGTAVRLSLHRAHLATDTKGNLYVSDPVNFVIRKITPEGRVTTPIGRKGRAVFEAGDLSGSIGSPQGIAVRGSTLYISVPNAVLQVNLPD